LLTGSGPRSPGGGGTFAFEIVCKFAPGFDGGTSNGGNDEGWWSSGGGWTDEFDFFEHWGWRGPPSVTASVWVYSTSPLHNISIPMNVSNLLGADPAAAFHRYTTVIHPDNSYSMYIDGRLVGSQSAPPSFQRVWMKLILSYAMRNPAGSDPRIVPGFTTPGETRDWVIRSVAVYQDAAHAGVDIRRGKIAPGTVIQGTTGGGGGTAPTAPAAPSLSVSGGVVTVRWGVVTNATDYGLYRRVSGVTAWTALGFKTGTSAMDVPAAGLTYQYSVSARNSVGESAQSATASIAVPPPAPGVPSAPTASVSGTVVSLSWNAISGATSYGVYRRLQGTSVWGSAVKAVASTSTTDSPAAGLYEYAITARTSTSESVQSAVASVSVGDVSPPEEGSDIEIVSLALGDEGVDVEIISAHISAPIPMTALTNVSVVPAEEALGFFWTAPPSNQNVSEIHIYVWRLGTVKPTVPGFVGLGVTSGSRQFATVGGLTGGVGYQWEIRPARDE
jgi:hypothetical protein